MMVAGERDNWTCFLSFFFPCFPLSSLVLSPGAWAWGYAVGLRGKGTPFGSAQREHHAPPAAQPGEGAGLRHRHQGQGGQYGLLL